MTRWKRYWERRERRRKALQLLNLSGAIRSVDVEPRYLGPERTIGMALTEESVAARGISGLLWTGELRQLWQACTRKRGVATTIATDEQRAA